MCKHILEDVNNLPCQSKISEPESCDLNNASGQFSHITADFEEQLLHRTPERDEEFSDFDNDDDVADPDYYSNAGENDDEPSSDEEHKKQPCRKRRPNPAKWKKKCDKKETPLRARIHYRQR